MILSEQQDMLLLFVEDPQGAFEKSTKPIWQKSINSILDICEMLQRSSLEKRKKM
jgi:hypothetical protein